MRQLLTIPTIQGLGCAPSTVFVTWSIGVPVTIGQTNFYEAWGRVGVLPISASAQSIRRARSTQAMQRPANTGTWLRQSIAAMPALAEAIKRQDLGEAAAGFEHVAVVESQAYTELSEIIDVTNLQRAS